MSPPHPRLLRHPGPVTGERITAVTAPAGRTLRLELAPNTGLARAVVEPLAAAGITDAVLTLLSGPWTTLTYCTGVPDPSGVRLATYAEPQRADDVLLIAGSVTLGRDPEGAPLVHAHGSFVTADGDLLGGHLVPDACTSGAAPTTAYVTALPGMAIRQVADAETNHRVFRPFAAEE